MPNYLDLKKGDQVMYSREFLRNIGTYTGEICFVIGEVLEDSEIVSPGHAARVCRVLWVGHSPSWGKEFISEYLLSESRVLTCNLERSVFPHILWNEVE